MSNPSTAPARIQELRYAAESTPAAAIGTPSSYWASGFSKVKHWDANVANLKYAAEDDPSVAINSFEDRGRLLTAQEGAVPFKTFLTGQNQTAAGGLLAVEDDLGLLLKAALGGEHLGTCTTAVVPGSGLGATTPIDVASVAGIVPGSAVCINGEARRVVSVSNTTLVTLDMDLTSAPANGDLVIVGSTYYLAESALASLADAGHITLAALLMGYQTEDQYQLRGVFPELDALENFGPGKLGNLSLMLHQQAWKMVTGVARGAAYTTITPPPVVAGGFYIQAQGTPTKNLIHVSNPALKFGLKVEAIPSPSGEQGVIGHVAFGGRTQLEFDALFANAASSGLAAWNTWYEARTLLFGGYQIGKPTTTTGAVLISFPQLTIDETPARGGAKDGPTMLRAKLHGDQYLSGSTDAAKSRVSIHRFPHL